MDEWVDDDWDDNFMASVEFIFTIGYLLFTAGLLVPPTEFVSAGLTIQNVFGNLLGSENLHFINYHIRRTATTAFIHALLPIGYYIGIGICCPKLNLFYLWKITKFWQCYLIVAITILLSTILLVHHWYKNGWKNHPIVKNLKCHINPERTSWRDVASSINIEFRRVDKFTTGLVGWRLIATDSWIMKTSAYTVDIAHQNDIHLTLSKTDEHAISHDGNPGTQYLQIKVVSINENIKPFKIRLNSLEYGDLREKLQQPVRTARDVVIHQSLSERFLSAFLEQVDTNECFVKPESMEVETCIGCMRKDSDVKLNKLCENLRDGDCVQCYCRPMWCLECMGKWFASRQNQQEPETWMSSKAHCPTCRARFCMLDVCKLA